MRNDALVKGTPRPMSSELLSGTTLDAWQRLLRAHGVIARVLDAEMQAAHGITLSDYDVLVNLRDADDCLKMSELSRRALLTRSGMTRLVQGLERHGYVSRSACNNDARVSYAGITAAGRQLLTSARVTHHQGIRRVFADHLSEAEIAAFANTLAKIPGVVDMSSCPSADDDPLCGE
ncbi:MAG: transcriptional regulator, MarR family [Thermoleophilia bacterium]|nr:transcriptional regulator, MarR family [Thermoleophilia bacterium]